MRSLLCLLVQQRWLHDSCSQISYVRHCTVNGIMSCTACSCLSFGTVFHRIPIQQAASSGHMATPDRMGIALDLDTSSDRLHRLSRWPRLTEWAKPSALPCLACQRTACACAWRWRSYPRRRALSRRHTRNIGC